MSEKLSGPTHAKRTAWRHDRTTAPTRTRRSDDAQAVRIASQVADATDGSYTAAVRPDENGQSQVTARYAGDANYLGSSAQCGFTVRTVPPPVKSASTTPIACPASANQRTTFQLTGAVSPPHPQSSVQVTWIPPGGGSLLHTVSTDDQSNYADSLNAGDAGTWLVQAYWPGDADHQDSYSQICQFDAYFIPK